MIVTAVTTAVLLSFHYLSTLGHGTQRLKSTERCYFVAIQIKRLINMISYYFQFPAYACFFSLKIPQSAMPTVLPLAYSAIH